MDNLRIFFPWLSDYDYETMRKPVAERSVPLPNLVQQCQEECDVLCPIDETTGHRTNMLTKVMDPGVSPLLKEQLMASLQKMPTSQRHNLSDEDLAKLLPSRYNMTLTDNEKFANDIRGFVDDANAELDKNDVEPTTEPTTEPSGNVE